MKKILIATDFSKVATNAAYYGAEMAKAIGADIILFHTYHIPVSAAELPLQSVNVLEMKHAAEESMAALEEKIKSITGNTVNVSTEAILGYMPEDLETYCKKINPFIIIMGAKGQTDLENIFFGSTTLSTIRHLTWPIIAIPEVQKYSSIKNIGFACDFTEAVETTPADRIKEIVKTFNARLHVIKISTHNRFIEITPHETVLLHTMLDDIKPVYHYIEHTDVEAGVHQFAKEHNMDMIIVIPKKHSLIGKLFHTSNTKKFITKSEIPVLCMHDE
ncbi:universal stress protein [Ferruginibacter lapsinanis]|uniref:universal stress protein n=1 Tax=Ferruginibacter lapsinanis TaxID=563172 RepID=UPI001E566C04|nr:universal stress protein [Ferruginibacter lapsinanis]UEG49149.1 universal stress protein [Ferruginibacter lapsinanis]